MANLLLGGAYRLKTVHLNVQDEAVQKRGLWGCFAMVASDDAKLARWVVLALAKFHILFF